MKTKVKNDFSGLLLSAMSLVIAGLQLISCGGSSDPTLTAQDAVRAKLLGSTWIMHDVSVDGVDQTGVYKGLKIKFDETSFTSINGGVVWLDSGTWSFSNDDGTMIKRDDGLEIRIEVTDTTLKLTLTWTKTTLGGGRYESVKGLNVFSFVKS